MKDSELLKIVEVIVPYIKKELLKDNDFKNIQKITQAEVISVNESGTLATLRMPFDTKLFVAPINTTDEIAEGDNVFIGYWQDLKNAHVIYKNKERE